MEEEEKEEEEGEEEEEKKEECGTWRGTTDGGEIQRFRETQKRKKSWVREGTGEIVKRYASTLEPRNKAGSY